MESPPLTRRGPPPALAYGHLEEEQVRARIARCEAQYALATPLGRVVAHELDGLKDI